MASVDLIRSIDVLCGELGVQPSCSDAELRRAYRQLVLKNHPDKNHDDPAATERTQQIIQAYEELKALRSHRSEKDRKSDTFDIVVRFGRDIREVAQERRTLLNETWASFQRQPRDPLRAVRFVHAAFEAEQARSDIVRELLIDPTLIDAAPMLLSDFAGAADIHGRCGTLIRWADYLWDMGRSSEAIQILEDGLETGLATPALKEALRSLHYRTSQYPNKLTGETTPPDRRITHLRRIVDLGYDLDYINKLLAEANYELGDSERAREYLERAYAINPALTGAARITRALGFPSGDATSTPRPAAVTDLRWTRPAQIPPPAQIREWAHNQQWDLILEFANPADYSRRALPKARDTLRAIGEALGSRSDPAAVTALTVLLHFNYYYDVAQAAAASLAQIGDATTLDLLKSFGRTGPRTWNETGKLYLRNCISYLEARIDGSHALVSGEPFALVTQAKREAANENYGLARFLLENAIGTIPADDSDCLRTMLLFARSCAAMNDVQAATEIVQSIIGGVVDSNERPLIDEVCQLLWRRAVMEEYPEPLEVLYQWAIDLNLRLISLATKPEEALAPLRALTRWLEKLGAGRSANIIRDFIRLEAPGSGFVDVHDRANYVKDVTLSPSMFEFLDRSDARVKAEAFTRVEDLMGKGAHRVLEVTDNRGR